MKIREWKELNNVENEKFVLFYENSIIKLMLKGRTRLIDFETGYIRPCHFDGKDTVLAWLKLFGFDIEFEKEITITQEEHDFLQWLYTRNNGIKIYRPLPNTNWQSDDITWSRTSSYFVELPCGIRHPVSDLLKYRVEG